MASDAERDREAQLDTHYAHCDRLVYEKDRDGWLACLFAPRKARRHLHAIGAFTLEIADVRSKVSQPLLGEMRLRWWIDAIEAAPGAEAGVGARAHPIADALLDTIDRISLARAEFVESIDAHVFDLYDDPMESMATLDAYCSKTAALPMSWRARVICGEDAAPPRAAFDDAGVALGLTMLLRALPRAAAAGQVFLPLDILARHGVTPDEARAGVASASAGLRGALAELRNAARDRYARARRAAHGLGAARAALLPAAVVPLYLEQMERRDYDPFRTLVEPPQWRRQWRLWRAARGDGL